MPSRRPYDSAISEDLEDYESPSRPQSHGPGRQRQPASGYESNGEAPPVQSRYRRQNPGIENDSDLDNLVNKRQPYRHRSGDEIGSLPSSVQHRPRHEPSIPDLESSSFLRLRGGSDRRRNQDLEHESPEDRHLRLAIEASEAEARNARSRLPSDLGDDELDQAIKASKEEAKRLARERAHREEEDFEREENILAESRRLGDEVAVRETRRRQQEAEVERVLRESVAEAERRKAEDAAELERMMAGFGSGRSGTTSNPRTRSMSASSSTRPQGSRGPRIPTVSTPASSSRAPLVSSPLARPSNVISAQALTTPPNEVQPPPPSDRGLRRQATASARLSSDTNSNTRSQERPSTPRNRERAQELSRSASARSAGSERNASPASSSRASVRPRATSLLSNSSTTSDRPVRNTSTSSRRTSRPDQPIERNAPGGAAEIERAVIQSRLNEINQILQRSDPSDPRYLAALASLDQVDGQAPEAPSLEDTGLEDGFRPPSYDETRKDKLINSLKYTTTNEGKNEAGRKMLITPAILKRMREAAAAMAAAQEKEPAPQLRSAAKRNPLEAAMAASKAEMPTAGSVEVAQSLEETLDRTFLNERRGQITTAPARPAETLSPARIATNPMRAQMTQLAGRDRPAWNEPFTRIPNSGGDPSRRRERGRTGL